MMTHPDTPTTLTRDDDGAALLRQARARIALKGGLAVHAAVYLMVNLLLIGIDAATGAHRWSVWPLAGWGLGLGVHALVVGLVLSTGGLQERLTAREVARLRARRV
jgi:hypothetical protein